MAFLLAGAGIGAHIGWFLGGSAAHGSALINQARRAIGGASAACGHRLDSTGRGKAHGLLEAPALGMVAPVEEGTSDAVLNDAVGHVPASVWPGRPGTSVFSAHNVTWFSRINHLRVGDEVRYVTPCRTYSYRVTSHRRVRAGYPVYNTPAEKVVLDTCYPPNALYSTSTRYLVYATLVRTGPSAGLARLPARSQLLAVPAPPALAAEGLTLAQNHSPVGLLRLTGAPSAAWQQTNGPLDAEAAALAAYFGVIRSAGQAEHGWWRRLAPGVPRRAAADLWGGEIVGYNGHLNVTLRVHGDRVTGARLGAVVTTDGSARPGIYYLTVHEAVADRGKVLVTGFRMRSGG
ncbi:MAG: class D sortase [Actinobacteria bacterium]|nr:class D sortase [Actinomycetota bacterium]